MLKNPEGIGFFLLFSQGPIGMISMMYHPTIVTEGSNWSEPVHFLPLQRYS